MPRSQPSPPTLPWAARVLWVEAHGVLCLRGPAPSTELAGRSLPAWGGEERTPDHSGSSEPTEMKQLSALSAGGCLRIKKKNQRRPLTRPRDEEGCPHHYLYINQEASYLRSPRRVERKPSVRPSAPRLPARPAPSEACPSRLCVPRCPGWGGAGRPAPAGFCLQATQLRHSPSLLLTGSLEFSRSLYLTSPPAHRRQHFQPLVLEPG